MEQKPLILRIDDAKQELVQYINDFLQRHGLACYLIEPMFAEMHTNIKNAAKNELVQARIKEAVETASKEE